jgi:hypothetical protein
VFSSFEDELWLGELTNRTSPLSIHLKELVHEINKNAVLVGLVMKT